MRPKIIGIFFSELVRRERIHANRSDSHLRIAVRLSAHVEITSSSSLTQTNMFFAKCIGAPRHLEGICCLLPEGVGWGAVKRCFSDKICECPGGPPKKSQK